ncbi:MAG TPA: transporter substrate-binding domain-containing protein [Beijerinckiaceae bacterium]|nr:transporter substrate-binding domain-containing protein [Beijerinckiaceae bacterium]
MQLRLLALVCLLLTAVAAHPAAAQGVAIPNFWDPRARLERPDLTGLRTVRFLTDDEFPPLHFAGPDGSPTGFSVELARAACERLAITCTIQARRFDTLLDSLAEGRGDVVAAAVPIRAELRRRFSITLPYFRTPARFAALKDRVLEPGPQALDGRAVGVVAGTAHEAYFTTFFPRAAAKTFATLGAATAALRRGEVEYVFGDGLGLALWVGGTDAAGCCNLTGGPYLESRFFGEGIGFLLRKEDENLRRALDFALQRLWEEGRYAELYLRFFPVSPF